MKSINNLGAYPTSLSMVADDILEFHAARLLLLIKICGEKGSLKGLTKLAKLDFFIRYPQFFKRAAKYIGEDLGQCNTNFEAESTMVRYHYGPWDQRYYHVLAYLEAKGLIEATKEGSAIILNLTDIGNESSIKLERSTSFAPIVDQMRQVKKALGNKKGTELKNLVYEVFDEEVSKLSMGEVITP
jgi:DNA-binding PadR family transcriptional regulator